MAKELIKFEIFIRDSRGARTSCGIHQTEIEDNTYLVSLPENYIFCENAEKKFNFVSIKDIELSFIGKVQP